MIIASICKRSQIVLHFHDTSRSGKIMPPSFRWFYLSAQGMLPLNLMSHVRSGMSTESCQKNYARMLEVAKRGLTWFPDQPDRNFLAQKHSKAYPVSSSFFFLSGSHFRANCRRQKSRSRRNSCSNWTQNVSRTITVLALWRSCSATWTKCWKSHHSASASE